MAIITVTQENYAEIANQADKPVLLDFWASWCGPCRMVAPIVEEIAQENESILVGKVDVDDQMALASQFGITSIPTLVLLRNGQAVSTVVGYRPKADILQLLDI